MLQPPSTTDKFVAGSSSDQIVLIILTRTILQFALVALFVESVEVNGGAAGLIYFSLLVDTEARSIVASLSLPAGGRALRPDGPRAGKEGIAVRQNTGPDLFVQILLLILIRAGHPSVLGRVTISNSFFGSLQSVMVSHSHISHRQPPPPPPPPAYLVTRLPTAAPLRPGRPLEVRWTGLI